MATKQPKIDLTDDDFGAVINCAIRYCLGRETYMPSLVTTYVKPLLPWLSDKTVACMERDVRECKHYGMDCDETTWLAFLGAIRAEMYQRKLEAWN